MKKTVRIISIVLCIYLFVCVPVSAARPNVDFFVKESGGVVTVTVETDDELGAIQGVLGYDKDLLHYNTFSANGSISSQNSPANTVNNTAGSTAIALVGNPASGTDGEWAVISYAAEQGTPADFDLDGFQAFSVTGALEKAGYSFIMPGDVNDDKLVDIKDYIKFKKVLATGDSYDSGISRNLDIDRGGIIDDRDFNLLRSDYILL